MSKNKLKEITGTKLFTLSLLLVIIIVVLEIVTQGMLLKLKNIRNILQSTTVVSFLTIGAGLLLISGNTDLSLGGVGTLGPMITALLLVRNWPWYAALLVALICCACCGAINAFMVNELKFPTFIATLAMASVANGMAYTIADGQYVDIRDPVLTFVGTARLWKYIPYSLFFSLAALLIYGLMLKKSKFGRSIYLIGGNAEAARLAGLKPKKISYILFMNASCMACIAGVLMASRIKSATCTGLAGSQFTGITAAILGGISFGGGTGGMAGALVGILILNVFENGMQLMAIPVYWQTVASGVLLIVALIYDKLASRRAL